MSSGLQGAYLLRDSLGARFILKWEAGATDLGRMPAVLGALKRLREAGLPVPRYTAVGLCATEPIGRYSIQELLPGDQPTRLDDWLLDRVIAANEAQSGIGMLEARPPRGWSVWLQDLTLGRRTEDFCQTRAMRAYSLESARLLDAFQSLMRSNAGINLAERDIVHFDFGVNQLLVRNVGTSRCRITGVVDWEGLVTGDRLFDLASLLFYAYSYRNQETSVVLRLWRYLVETVGINVLSIYLVHLAQREIDWCIRHESSESVREAWRLSTAVLSELESRSRWRLLAP